VTLLFLATQLPSLQTGLFTQPLTGPQWLAVIGLALVLPVVVESSKLMPPRRAPLQPANVLATR
jgi:P-type Ca2+ transporter type 2C